MSQSLKLKAMYEKYQLALSFYGIETKSLKKPTEKSIENIKKQWQKHNKELREQGWIDLPSVSEAAKVVKASNELHERISPTNNPELYGTPLTTSLPTESDINDQALYNIMSTIDGILQDIDKIVTDYGVSRKSAERLEEKRNNLKQKVRNAYEKSGRDSKFIDRLVSSPFYNRIQEVLFEVYRTYGVVEDTLDDELPALLEDTLQMYLEYDV